MMVHVYMEHITPHKQVRTWDGPGPPPPFPTPVAKSAPIPPEAGDELAREVDKPARMRVCVQVCVYVRAHVSMLA
jgi:hypothetical protein